MKNYIIKFFILFLLLSLTSCPIYNNVDNNNQNTNKSIDVKNTNWTIMMYLGGDNNLEYDLMRNVKQMKESYQGGCNIIVFIDRSPKYSINSTIFGNNFTGARIYKIVKNNIKLLEDESFFYDVSDTSSDNTNSANILVLKKFIEYCKANYPANYYALFIGSHGGGARKINYITEKEKNIVFDETSNRWLYTKEFTDKLEEKDSVDLLGIDACFMGNIEFIYQLKNNNGSFHSKYIVASPPTEWSYGWNYSGILKRITDRESYYEGEATNDITGEQKKIYSSTSLTPLDLGKILIEEQYEYTRTDTDDQILVLYDTEKIDDLKSNFDSLFVSLKDNSSDIFNLRGFGFINQKDTLFYFDSDSTLEWLDYSYFDIYDICDKIELSDNFSSIIINKAKIVKQCLKNVILYSFSGSYFKRFKNNVNGISFFFPDGERLYLDNKMWQYQTWYSPLNDKNYGNLSFCKNNATQKNGVIENYFEVLDYWFDYENGYGGINGYEY